MTVGPYDHELARLNRLVGRVGWLAWFVNIFAFLIAMTYGHWYSGIGNLTIVVGFAWHYWLVRTYDCRIGVIRR